MSILVNHTDAKHLNQLFNFMLQGEQLAMHYSKIQSRLTSESSACRFLKQQSRHERFHVQVFQAGKRFVNYRGSAARTSGKTMQIYAGLLDDAVSEQNYAETIMALQVILEGLGDVILERLNDAIEKRGQTFKRVRRIILGQEDAHHHFGLKALENILDQQPEIKPCLQDRSICYFELIHRFLDENAALFSHYHIDPQIYLDQLNLDLPDWLEYSTS